MDSTAAVKLVEYPFKRTDPLLCYPKLSTQIIERKTRL